MIQRVNQLQGKNLAGAGAEFDITGKLKSANIDGSYGNTSSHSQSSTAVVGGINAAGNVNVVTKQGATFERTQLLSGGDTSISGKNVTFNAAQNTASSTTEIHKAGIAVKVETSEVKQILVVEAWHIMVKRKMNHHLKRW